MDLACPPPRGFYQSIHAITRASRPPYKSTFAYSFVAEHFAATGPVALLIMNIDEPAAAADCCHVGEMEIVAHNDADKLMNTASECVVSGEDGLPEGALRVSTYASD